MLTPSPQPDPKPRLPPRAVTRPKRVVAGVRLANLDIATSSSWLTQRWLGILNASSDSESRTEGFEYARLGQTRRLDVSLGSLTAVVQGRASTPHHTVIRFPIFGPELWDVAERALASQAGHAARLLTGEVHADLEALLKSLGIDLLPETPEATAPNVRTTPVLGIETTCTCKRPAWCKHACCAAYLLAERLAREPLTIFALRGIAAEELIERVRHRRSAASSTDPAAPIHTAYVPGVSDITPKPLESCADHFWTAEVDPADLDFTAEPPEVKHPLLRRLGASPFERGKFPLVGLLATCYEVITEAAIHPEKLNAPPHE